MEAKEEYRNLKWLEKNSDFQGNFGDFSNGFQISTAYEQYLKDTFGALNWYEWNVNNYGCKWDVEVLIKKTSPTSIEIHELNSPWSPPVAFFEFLASKGLAVFLAFEHDAKEFGGHYSSADGLVKYDGEDWLLYMLQQGEELKYLLDLEAYSSLQEWLDSGYEMPKNQVLIDGVHKYFTKQ